MQNYSIFIDDLRDPIAIEGDVVVARSTKEAIEVIKTRGLPVGISFDHDLGEDANGKVLTAVDFLWWLINEDLDGNIDLTKIEWITVHSANPVGADNIAKLWNSFAVTELKSKVRAVVSPRI